MFKTKWKLIPGYEQYYQISDQGQVRSTKVSSRNPKGKQYLLKPLSAHGYMGVTLTHPDKNNWRMRISRMVLLLFTGPPPEGKPYALHNDGDPSNNWNTNLRWGSNSENQKDRELHGTSNHGVRNGSSKLTEQDIKDIRSKLRASNTTQKTIAKEYGVYQSVISRINSGNAWCHI